MTATGATDGTGSGVKEYMYFVDNKAGASDTIVRKTVGTDASPNVASFTANMGRYLGQVAVVDKAGNVSNVQGDPDARTKVWGGRVYSVSLYNVPYQLQKNTMCWTIHGGTKLQVRNNGHDIMLYTCLSACREYLFLETGPKPASCISHGDDVYFRFDSWVMCGFVVPGYECAFRCIRMGESVASFRVGTVRSTDSDDYCEVFLEGGSVDVITRGEWPLSFEGGEEKGIIYSNERLYNCCTWIGKNIKYNIEYEACYVTPFELE